MSRVASVLQRKTLAQAGFTPAEQVKSPVGVERVKRAEPKKKDTPKPQNVRILYSLPARAKIARSRASQAFCSAKPWRRRDSLPPSRLNHPSVWSEKSERNPKREPRPKDVALFLVRLKGLEPPVSRFVAAHSIQLSYRRIAVFLGQLKYNSTGKIKKQVFYFFLRVFITRRRPVSRPPRR